MREKILYGGGVLVSLIILGGGVGLMLMAMSTNTNESAEQSSQVGQTAEEEPSASSSSGASSAEQNRNTQSTAVLSPSLILPSGVHAFQVVGDFVVYIDDTGTIYRTSLRTGRNVELEQVELGSPSYVYLPPQEEPSFVITKEDGRYRTVMVEGSANTYQFPSRVKYLAVEPSGAVYAVTQPQEGVSRIEAFDITGQNPQTILSRQSLSRIQVAGNSLFYTAQQTLYEYDLSASKERTIITSEEGVPRFNMNGNYYVGVVTSEEKTYLYQFSDTPRQRQTLDLDIAPRRTAWSQEKRALLYVKNGQLHTFSWQEDSLERTALNLGDISIAYPHIAVDQEGGFIFLSTSNQAGYRLVSGRI